MDRRSDASRLWRAILGMAAVVAALFVIDPFTSSGDDPTEDRQGPFVAILARDEVVDRPETDQRVVVPDEVLGEVVVPEEPPALDAGPPPADDGSGRAGDSTDGRERGLRVILD